jgi:CheY-like chemotaxis protein
MCTILLVDDDFENRWALQLALETRGYRVVLAHNGRDALQKAHADFPELVITDFEMPEMDGEELCRRLKCEAIFSDLPVLLLSAMPEPREVRCSTVFFRKPASIEILLDTVDTFLAARLTYTRTPFDSGYPIARWQAIDSRCWP